MNPARSLAFHVFAMPTVSVDKALLFQGLGHEYTTQEFDELCFQFGIELDEDTTEEVAGTDERPQLKIDIPANRYDLLCFEGILRALRVFLGHMEPPKYRLSQPKDLITMNLTPDTARIRPYFAGAVLRNIKFTPERYANFIDLQDKLHQNLARHRTLVSMGTHDLDTIEAPFTYDALPPSSFRFAPLNRMEEYDGKELMKLFEQGHLSRYLPIIRDSPVYPIIFDAQRRVMSMPPIINSNHSKITLDTRNVFIDVTAVDKTKLDIVTNILVTMFSEYCEEPFNVEPVRVVYPDGKEVVTPNLEARSTILNVSYVNRCTGLKHNATEIARLLHRMGHDAQPAVDSDKVNVKVPVTRPDILHECDLMEDAAVAYGFDNLPKTFPRTTTVGGPLPINKLGDIIRRECAYSGWIEILPLILCSRDENFTWMKRVDDGNSAIVLENPKTAEYQVVRTSLIPGILKTIRENKNHSLPIRVFEVSDVAFKDATETFRMARNERHVSAVYCNKAAEFEMVHGLFDKLMLSLGVPRIMRDDATSPYGYYLKEANDPTFFPGRAAYIYFRKPVEAKGLDSSQDLKEALENDRLVGILGVLHPEVIQHFEIAFPCSAIEFNLEPFL